MKDEEKDQKHESRSRAIEAAVSQIEKQFGKGSVMKLGQKEAALKVPAIPTGSIAFDQALGIGGFPRGRVVEVFGPAGVHARSVVGVASLRKGVPLTLKAIVEVKRA